VSVRAFLAVLRTGWWAPIAGLLIGGLVALISSLLSPPLFTSHLQLFVSAASGLDVFREGELSQERAGSYTELISGQEVTRRVVERLGLDSSPQELEKRISADVVPGTFLIEVTVTDRSPQRAQRIAAVLAEELRDLVGALETADGVSVSPVRLSVARQPDLPAAPSSPQPVRDLGYGLAVGLLMGTALLAARAQLDRRVTAPEEAALLVGAPVLGLLTRDQNLRKRQLVAPGSQGDEEYRRLRVQLRSLGCQETPIVVGITSSLPREGTSTLVVNLARALADSGRRVAIVDGDRSRPAVARYLGMAAVVESVSATRGGQLRVVGRPAPPEVGDLLAGLRAGYDLVLVDAPAVLSTGHSTELVAHADAVLLVVRHGRTATEALRRAAAELRLAGVRTAGVVLTFAPRTAGGRAVSAPRHAAHRAG
jgi:Mrp family chromosome partitioning ATPase